LLVERLLADLESFDPHRLLAFINGAGGTSKMEMHILYQRLFRTLTEHGLVIEAGVVDSFFTTQEMGGFSLSLCALDDELVPYWDVPACGPAFCWPRLPRI
jgi:dihydroxyacetone kinase-like protein